MSSATPNAITFGAPRRSHGNVPRERTVKLDGQPTTLRVVRDAHWAQCFYRWHCWTEGHGSLHLACADTLRDVQHRAAAILNIQRDPQ